MKSARRILRLMIVVPALAYLAPAYLACTASAQIMEGAKIRGFRWPDYDDHGELKSVVTGESAEVKNDGLVSIEKLKFEFYEDGTNIQMTVTAPRCVYDRNTGIARSTSSVRIQSEQMIVTGKDFTFDRGKERFQIRKDAKVEILNARKRMEASTQAEEKDK